MLNIRQTSLLPNPTFIENTENQLAEAQFQLSKLRPGSVEHGQPRSDTPSEKPALGEGLSTLQA